MQKNHINIGRAKLMAGCERLDRVIDQSKVHDLDTRPGELTFHHTQVTFQPLFQAGKLRPVSVKADAEESDSSEVAAHVVTIKESTAGFKTLASRLLAASWR
jgi:hypothetical protein